MQKRKIELPLTLWPPIAYFLSIAMHANFLFASFIFFGIPILFLSLYTSRKILMKALTFSLLLGVPFVIIIDYLMEVSGGWYIPLSAFGTFRIFGLVTMDIIIWIILHFVLIILLYEVFYDSHKNEQIARPRMKWLLLISIICFLSFIILFLTTPSSLVFNHVYLKAGVVISLIPITLVLLFHPKLGKKFIKIGLYFFYLTLIYEICALKLGHWTFPDTQQFVGTISILNLWFPLEEFVFWMLLTSTTTLAWYEYFDDDEK